MNSNPIDNIQLAALIGFLFIPTTKKALGTTGPITRIWVFIWALIFCGGESIQQLHPMPIKSIEFASFVWGNILMRAIVVTLIAIGAYHVPRSNGGDGQASGPAPIDAPLTASPDPAIVQARKPSAVGTLAPDATRKADAAAAGTFLAPGPASADTDLDSAGNPQLVPVGDAAEGGGPPR